MKSGPSEPSTDTRPQSGARAHRASDTAPSAAAETPHDGRPARRGAVRRSRTGANATASPPSRTAPENGNGAGAADDSAAAPKSGRGSRRRPSRRRTARPAELERLREALAAMRDGDFSVRMEVDDGDELMTEIAAVFDEVASRNERLVNEITRIGTTVGREGDMSARAEIGDAGGDWAVALRALNALVTGLVAPTTEVARVIKAVAEGDLSQKMSLEIDGKEVQGEFLRTAPRSTRWWTSSTPSPARSPAWPARWAPRASSAARRDVRRRRRHLEGPHRQRELDGEQPDQPGAQHRPRDHRGGQRRPVAEDHGGRAGRDPGAEGHHQHDGGPAERRSPTR